MNATAEIVGRLRNAALTREGPVGLQTDAAVLIERLVKERRMTTVGAFLIGLSPVLMFFAILGFETWRSNRRRSYPWQRDT